MTERPKPDESGSDMQNEIKNNEKLDRCVERLSATEIELEALRLQMAPLQERLSKLNKDADYWRSRVSKYRNRMTAAGPNEK